MRSDVQARHQLSRNPKNDPQVWPNLHGVDLFLRRRHTDNLMRTQPWIKWIVLEDNPGISHRFPLPMGKRVKTPPEPWCFLENVVSHLDSGGLSGSRGPVREIQREKGRSTA